MYHCPRSSTPAGPTNLFTESATVGRSHHVPGGRGCSVTCGSEPVRRGKSEAPTPLLSPTTSTFVLRLPGETFRPAGFTGGRRAGEEVSLDEDGGRLKEVSVVFNVRCLPSVIKARGCPEIFIKKVDLSPSNLHLFLLHPSDVVTD